MKQKLKNLLSINNKIKSYKHYLLEAFFISSFLCQGQQITNYINNGGFENYSCGNNLLPECKYWGGIDSLHCGAVVLSYCNGFAPSSGNTFQYPRTDSTFVGATFLWPSPGSRCYLRNRMKGILQAGKTYCVKFHVNVANTSPRAIDAFQMYFGDNQLDTITQDNIPLSYISPQITNPTGNFITDTLNWIPITGTFVANGNEKFAVIGNFKSDAATSTQSLNSPYYPQIWSDVCIDDVSCIDIDLPAYAGPDAWILPGDSVFIGRQPDVGIDEACIWYKMPNTTAAIDTVAGLWVKPSATTSYLVRQEICGNVKWDLVTIYISATGQLEIEQLTQNLKVFPQPAQNEINLKFEIKNPDEFSEVEIFNNLGERVKQQNIEFSNKQSSIKTEDLSEGVYFLSLKNNSGITIKKRFVIVR